MKLSVSAPSVGLVFSVAFFIVPLFELLCNGFDNRLSHDFWVVCQDSFIQIKLLLALVAFITWNKTLSHKDVLNLNV